MHCIKCGVVVPAGASFCPACGTPVNDTATPAPPISTPSAVANRPKKKRSGCLVFGLVALVAIIVLAFIGSLLPKAPVDQGADNQSAESAVEPKALPLAVTAKELFGAYAANEASAQSYFGTRQLLVSATIDKVALDLFNNPEVLLRTPNQFMSAHAALADDAKDKAADYSPGDSIKLLCEDVSEVASIPMLKDCRPAPEGQKSQPVEWSRK